ncbi:P-loop containing nucleoside triphosphate hydrolase protein, partial [Blyttiomyces helicus]
GTSGIGTIISVEMVNFMCHKYHQIDLGPKVNFIMGQNGSGKSTILTAITICLGGKASFTNRATTLKGFLKTGATSGQVTVKLRNKGQDAYKPEVYGDVIAVERNLVMEGSGSYKIRSAKGVVISTKRDELINICDHLRIQADNPMAILTQDTAKTFLSNSTPKDKYEFFLKGTQLSQLSGDYALVREYIDQLNSEIALKKEVLPELRDDVKKLERIWGDFEKAKGIQQETEQVYRELLWMTIVDLEKDVSVAQKAVRVAESKREKVLPQIEQLKLHANRRAQVATCDDEISAIQEEMEQSNAAVADINKRKGELDGELHETKRQIAEIVQEERRMNAAMREAQVISQTLDQKITEEREKLKTDFQAERQKKLDEIERLKTLEQEYERQLYDTLEAELNSKRGEETDAKKEVLNLSNRVQALESQRSTSATVFGQQIPRVLAAIEAYDRQGRWKGSKPIGPLGMFVKIQQPVFAQVVETLIASTMEAFAVDTVEDQDLLNDILRQNNWPAPAVRSTALAESPITTCSPSIGVWRYRERPTTVLSFPISSDVSPSGQPLSLMLIPSGPAPQFTHEIARNQFIIQSRIEKQVLVRTRQEGDQITRHGLPQNALGVYTPEGHKIGARAGGFSTQSMNLYRGPPRLIKDIEPVIREHKEKYQQAKQHAEALSNDVQQIVNHRHDLQGTRNDLRAKANEIRRDIGKAKDKAQELTESMQAEEPANVVGLEELKKAQDEKIAGIRSQFSGFEDQKSVFEEQKAAIVSQQAHIKSEFNVFHAKHQDLR